MHRLVTAAIAIALALTLSACGAGDDSSASGSAPASASASGVASAPEDSALPDASATPVPWGHPAEGLALVQFPDSNSPVSHVFVVDTDGTLHQVTGISRESAGADWPAWSPDRTQLAFGPPKTGGGMNFEVGVVNADGSDERVLGQGNRPRWSPDGLRLLYEEVDDVTSEPRSIFVVDLATGTVTELTQGFSPEWVPPDSDRIGFRRLVGPTDLILVMSVSTGESEQLVTPAGTDPQWSPDGSTMLLVYDGAIALANPDGTDAHQLVDGYDPVWSPDGTRFAFAYDLNADAIPLLAVADLDGEVLWSGVAGGFPAWSPDGTRLAVDVAVPGPVVRVLDASNGDQLWEAPGQHPAW